MVVDRGGEDAFGAGLADDEGVEVGFEGGRGYRGWGVGVSEGALYICVVRDGGDGMGGWEGEDVLRLGSLVRIYRSMLL